MVYEVHWVKSGHLMADDEMNIGAIDIDVFCHLAFQK